MYRIELKNAYLPKYLENAKFTSVADATSALVSVLETLKDKGKQITGNVVDDVGNKSVATRSVNKTNEYIVYVRIGGWASQWVKANSKEEAEAIAIAHPEKWGEDYHWWYDESGCGGYEGIEGVYPKELQILNVEREDE